MTERVDGICRETFESMARAMLAPESGAAATPDEARLTAIELAARELRHIAAFGRRIGAPAFYNEGLRRTAQSLAAKAGLPVIDRRRLTEILLGPDQAAHMVVLPPTGPGIPRD